MISGAKALVKSLERAGAEVVFGYPGGNIVDVFHYIKSAKFRFVLGRHEQGCVHAADGYARATGRPGVAIVTSGPGLTNTITALGAANMDGVPLVLVSGQVPLSQIGTDAFQEADTTGITRAVSKHNFLVQSADEIPEIVAQAFYIATHGKPGPVVIDVPRNCQEAMTKMEYPERISLRAYHPEVCASLREAGKLAKLINNAKRPIIYAGGGVIASGAAEDVRALAEKAGIPVVTTLMGLGCIDGDLSLGFAGMHGSNCANRAIAESDLVIALGVRFNDRITGDVRKYARKPYIVHVDCDPSSIRKNVSVDFGIVADIKDLLTTISPRVKPAKHDEWLKSLKNEGVKCLKRQKSNYQKINPQELFATIDEVTKGEAIVVTDVGQHQIWAAQYLRHIHPRSFLTSGGMGAMGFGIPAAIGAAVAKRDRKVVAILGDGGAQMTSEELAVAVAEKLPITFFVVNNRSLGMVRQIEKRFFDGVYSSTEFTENMVPDFPMLAKAYGMRGVRVTKRIELASIVKRAIASRVPILVEVMIDPDAEVEPMIYR